MVNTLPAVFDKLGPNEIEMLKTYLLSQDFSRGECLFRAGEEGDDVIFIMHGKIRLEFDTVELDTEKVVAVLGDGDMIGELALLDDKVRSLSAYAETDVTVCRLGNETLARLMEEQSRLAACIYAALGRSAADKLRLTNTRFADYLSVSFAVHPEVDVVVQKAEQAQSSFDGKTDKQIDDLLYTIALEMIAHSRSLAEAAVRETRLGNVRDKDSKHNNVALGIFNTLAGRSGSGFIHHKRIANVDEIADSMGVVFGLVPVTNPVSTVIFKSMIALKSRNAIILSPNRLGSRVVVETVDLIRALLPTIGLDEDVIQVVRERQSRQMTAAFMRHPGVSLVLATGGSGMVKAAYSSGTPAIGVGPGNTPCMIASDARLAHAAESIVKSKSFDNGLICGSEHNLIVERSARGQFIRELERHGAAVLDADEKGRFMAEAITGTGELSRRVIGQDPDKIARRYDIMRDYPIRLIVVTSDDEVTADNPLAHEKIAPILSLFTVDSDNQGIDAAEKILGIEGGGHTAAIHTKSRKTTRAFGARMKASRILVNSPCVHGIIGLTTGLTASLTLGCGSYGGNSTTDNITYTHLLNTKRMAHYIPYKKTSDILDRLRDASPKILYGLRIMGNLRRLLRF